VALSDLPESPLYRIEMGDTTVHYNLTRQDIPVSMLVATPGADGHAALVIAPEARILGEMSGDGEARPSIPHHGLCVVGPRGNFWMELLAGLCSGSTVSPK
jgi:hypothetical protein